MMETKINLAVYRLARAFGHSWACEGLALELFDEMGWAGLPALQADYNAIEDSGIPPGIGIAPSISHTTMSGRFRWQQTTTGVDIAICRPVIHGVDSYSISPFDIAILLHCETITMEQNSTCWDALPSDGSLVSIEVETSDIALPRHYACAIQCLSSLGFGDNDSLESGEGIAWDTLMAGAGFSDVAPADQWRQFISVWGDPYTIEGIWRGDKGGAYCH